MNKYFLMDGIRLLEDITKNLYGNLSYLKCKIMYPKALKENVRGNNRFKDIHKGKRCFIIGNGPSLKEQDLSLLKGEIVFSVNQASRNPSIKKLNPKYHFWIDPVFFNLDVNKPEDMEVLQAYKDIYTSENRPITFLPQHAYDFVSKFELQKEIDVQFFFSKIFAGKKYKKDFDFQKAIPSFGTVVQACVAMAFYMGFSEIYLLGCDSTGILNMINGALNYSSTEYSYEVSENEKKRMHEMYQDSKYLKTSIIGFVELLDTFEKLYGYAKERNIILANCSAKTILTSIPRMELMDVFKED